MTASKLNLSIEQGATFRTTITWQTGSPLAPVNLTGASAELQIRADYGQPLLKQLDTTNGGITLGGAAGTIALYISATDTLAMTFDRAIYDLFITLPNGGDATKLVMGNVTVAQAVTHP